MEVVLITYIYMVKAQTMKENSNLHVAGDNGAIEKQICAPGCPNLP